MERTIIDANQTLWFFSKKTWKARQVLFQLLLMEYRVRYRQASLGILWAIFQPVFAMGIFTFTFGHVAKFSSGGLPYSIFALSGLVIWYYFSNSLLFGGTSIVESADLVKQAAFPRIFFPLTVVLSKLLDATIGIAFLAVFSWVYFPIHVSFSLLYVPIYLLLGFLCTFGIAIFLAALCVNFRDVKFLLPYVTQVLFFSTPVVYVIPKNILVKAPWILWMNPLGLWIQGFRQALYPMEEQTSGILLPMVLWAAVLVTVGTWYFGKMEKTFADTI